MKLFSLLKTAINSALGASPSAEQTDKARELCIDVVGGDPAVFGYIASGVQADVFECTFNVTLDAVVSERRTLVKLYKDPQSINFNRADDNRLNDVLNAYRSASEIGVGPEIYKTINNGSGENLEFAIVQEFLSGGDLENGPASKNDILEVAKLFGRNHAKPYNETELHRDFCYESWPWNTRAFGDHLNDEFFTGGRKFIQEHMNEHGIGNMTTLQEFYDYTIDQAEMAPSPAVFTHADPHKGNIFKLDDGTYRLLDFDNANIGPRIWDLIYFWNKLDNTQEDKDTWMGDYILAYVNEFNARSSVAITFDEIFNEFICHWPWHILQTAVFYNALSEFEPSIAGIDALFLFGMDAVLKDPDFPKCKSASEPEGSFFGKCDGTARSNDIEILNSSVDSEEFNDSSAQYFGLSLAAVFLTVFNL